MTLITGEALKPARFFTSGNPTVRGSSFDLTIGDIFDHHGEKVAGPFLLKPGHMVQVVSAEAFRPKRQTYRSSLGTADVEEATRRLQEYVALNERPRDGRPDQVLIDQVLLFYWTDRASKLPSARTQKLMLGKWQEWWSGRVVDEITSAKQKEFRLWLGEGVLRPSTIDKVSAAGAAALHYAVKHGTLRSAPHIFMIETKGEKEARPPLGRPLSIEEMAAFFDAIKEPHMMTFAVILANTLARSASIFDLRRGQFDPITNRIALNPVGRPQTGKRRPTLPVTTTLRRWLDMAISPDEYYVTYQGERLTSVNSAWRTTVADAGLEGKVTRYSFRHGIARLMRRRGISLDDIGTFMGHTHKGASGTTAIYVPDDPDYLSDAAEAIEGIMQDIQQHLRKANIRDPHASLLSLEAIRRRQGNHLSEIARSEMLVMIRAGKPAGEVRRIFGVSYAAIYKHRKKLRLG